MFFWGADTALYFLRAESCINIFFDAQVGWTRFFYGATVRTCFFARLNYLTLFFDAQVGWTCFFYGETCANVFFRTFELFDTMHAIDLN